MIRARAIQSVPFTVNQVTDHDIGARGVGALHQCPSTNGKIVEHRAERRRCRQTATPVVSPNSISNSFPQRVSPSTANRGTARCESSTIRSTTSTTKNKPGGWRSAARQPSRPEVTADRCSGRPPVFFRKLLAFAGPGDPRRSVHGIPATGRRTLPRRRRDLGYTLLSVTIDLEPDGDPPPDAACAAGYRQRPRLRRACRDSHPGARTRRSGCSARSRSPACDLARSRRRRDRAEPAVWTAADPGRLPPRSTRRSCRSSKIAVSGMPRSWSCRHHRHRRRFAIETSAGEACNR